jgi:hypothetical protein
MTVFSGESMARKEEAILLVNGKPVLPEVKLSGLLKNYGS